MGSPTACLPHTPKFSQFHAVFGKIWQSRMLALPPAENPGSPSGHCNLANFLKCMKREFNGCADES